MQNSEQSQPPGVAARDAGAERVLDQVGHEQWRGEVAAAIQGLAQQGRPFTISDVRELVAGDPLHPNAWGAALLGARREGNIVSLGYRKSERASRHAAPVAIWVGSD